MEDFYNGSFASAYLTLTMAKALEAPVIRVEGPAVG